ncbi:MAG: tandem-95 repeat protein, partial [Lutibacter sp.]|uniref:Ig-like domain-containing protein n=1 Tax=Lutibacter sp. TaxID=1925666 RepID=UPI0017BE754B
ALAGAGTYTYTIAATDYCPELTADVVVTEKQVNTSIESTGLLLTCSIDSVTLTANVGEEGTYTYNWSNGEMTDTIDISNPGSYTVVVTDLETGCSVSSSVIIAQDITKPVISLEADTTELTCDVTSIELTSEFISIQGTASYLWSKDQQLITGETSSTITVTEPGEYYVVVTDRNNGCFGVDKIVITQNITQPEVIIVGNEELSCSNPSITLDASQTIVIGDASYLWSTGDTSATLEVMEPGVYTVTVTDSESGCSSINEITISYNCTYAIDDINDTYMNIAVAGNVLTNDEDEEGNTQTVTGNTNADNGTVVLNSDGSYIYTPNDGFVGTDSFEYTICDDGSPQACDTATVTIEVMDITVSNNPPVANNDTATTEQNIPVDGSLLPNDFDPDGDLITVNTIVISGPTHGVVVINSDGSFTYTPEDGFTGEDTFTYEICDNGDPVLCDTADVIITVIPSDDNENDTYANDDAYNGDQENVITGNVLDNDFDPEGDTQVVNSGPITDVANGTLVLNSDGTFVYTPNDDFVGTDSFVYEVCDNGSPIACDQATVVITVNALNYTYAIDDINDTFIDMPVVGNVLTNDFDEEGDVQTVTTTTVTTSEGVIVTIDASTGVYMYTPPAGFIGTDSFEYTICDNGDLQACDTAIVTIEVLDVTNGNHPPVANNDTSTTEENTPVDGNLLVNDFDPNGDTITVNTTPIENPSNGTVVINSDGTYTYTPNDGFIGEDTFTYEICDNGDPVLCDTATVVITILPNGEVVNHTNANDDAYNGGVNTILTGNILDNDTDPEGDTQTVNTIPQVNVENGSLVLNSDGTFVYTPNDGFVGTDSFVYEVCDNGDPIACDFATVVITINPSNCLDFEIFVAVTSETCEGANGSATVDVSGAREPINYVWSNGQTTETATGLAEGLYTVTVTDANGCETTTEVTINFEGTNQEVEVDNILVLCVLDSSINLITDETNGLSSLVDNFVTGGTWFDNQNSGGLSGDFFDPSIVNLGDYELTYEEPGDCGRIITLVVSVNDDCVVLPCSTEGSIEISKVVTANNDGVNDFFTISEIASCGFTAEVTIFNRWGKVVYQSNNYQNNWGGYHDNSGLTIGTNNKLPAGTYYYVVNIIGSGYRPITGYIYLGTN